MEENDGREARKFLELDAQSKSKKHTSEQQMVDIAANGKLRMGIMFVGEATS